VAINFLQPYTLNLWFPNVSGLRHPTKKKYNLLAGPSGETTAVLFEV